MGRVVVEVQQVVVTGIGSSVPIHPLMLYFVFFSVNMGIVFRCCVCSCDVRFVLGCVHACGYCPFIHVYLVAIMDLVLRTDICGVLGVLRNSALTCGKANTIDDPGPAYPIGSVPRKGVLTVEFLMVFPIYDRFLVPPLIVNGLILAYVCDVASVFFFSVCSDMT